MKGAGGLEHNADVSPDAIDEGRGTIDKGCGTVDKGRDNVDVGRKAIVRDNVFTSIIMHPPVASAWRRVS